MGSLLTVGAGDGDVKARMDTRWMNGTEIGALGYL